MSHEPEYWAIGEKKHIIRAKKTCEEIIFFTVKTLLTMNPICQKRINGDGNKIFTRATCCKQQEFTIALTVYK